MSKEGKGSKVERKLDLVNTLLKPSEISALELHGQKILVVDDDLTRSTLLCQQLADWQVEHTSVDCGQNAIRVLSAAAMKEQPYDIAIVDIHMSKMNGIQLEFLINKHPLFASTRLIVMNRNNGETFNKAGFNARLNKPINQSALRSTLLKVAGMSNTHLPIAPPHDAHQQVHFNARILVVDDNPTNQFLAQHLLKKFGIQADIASNGEEAIKALETLSYDLVFMDCQMPVLDGYDATIHIRDTHSKVLDRNIPIIAMTADVLQESKEECLHAGMNDFIPKPVKSDKVLHALQQWLPTSDNSVAETMAIRKPINEAHSEPDTVIFDANAMKQRLMNNKGLIRKIIDAFAQDIGLQIKRLNTAIVDKDFVTAALQAHKIKGAAANVSGISLSALASITEDASKAEDLGTLFEMQPKIERDFILLKASMDDIL
jgi:CheY-like chemotaxis protein/HPt (histidine-containing phosphotransfer) domain-containing protein